MLSVKRVSQRGFPDLVGKVTVEKWRNSLMGRTAVSYSAGAWSDQVSASIWSIKSMVDWRFCNPFISVQVRYRPPYGALVQREEHSLGMREVEIS